MKEAVIVAGREPRRKSKKRHIEDMSVPMIFGAYAVRETLKRAGGYEGNIDDLIIGCAMPEAEQGLNMARNIGALAGLPHTVPAITINRYCSSGLQSIAYGAEKIMLGAADTIIAGGAESMSLVPMMGHIVRPNAKHWRKRLRNIIWEWAIRRNRWPTNTALPGRTKMHLPSTAIKKQPRRSRKESSKMKSSRWK